MLSAREMQTPAQLTDLVEKAYESAAFLAGYLTSLNGYIGRLPFTQGDALRRLAGQSAVLLDELAQVRGRVLTAKTVFADVQTKVKLRKGFTKRKSVAGVKPASGRRKTQTDGHPWRKKTDAEMASRAERGWK